MLDLMIRNGLVVTPNGAGKWDVGVAAGKIAAVTASGEMAAMQAGRIVDARDKIVIPGGIDPHNHCNWPLPPDPRGGPQTLSAGPAHVSRAALFGGTTTLMDFAIWEGEDSLEQPIAKVDAKWRGECHCDYAFHVMLQGKIPAWVLGGLEEV